MFEWIRQWVSKEPDHTGQYATDEKSEKDKQRELLLKEKDDASRRGEPWVGVLDIQVNEENIRNGFFELDWNNEFVEQLIDHGFQGESAEDIVDQWFRAVVNDVAGQEANIGTGYINIVPRRDGHSEAS